MNYESLDEALRPLASDALQSVIFSNPVPSKTKYRKIRAERNGNEFFVASYTVTQVSTKPSLPLTFFPSA